MKKIFVLVLAAMLALCLISCNKGDHIDYSSIDVVKEGYITLGNYKAVELDFSEVSDAELEAKIRDLVLDEQYDTFTAGRAAEDGDIVNIDYLGKVDGEAFEGGAAEDQTVFIGEGAFIEGFEDGIIGMNEGDTKVIDVTFPEDYHSEELAGKAATFDITLNIVYDPQIRTVAQNEAMAENLAKATEMDEDERKSLAWNAVLSEATVNKYPEKLLKNLTEERYNSNINSFMQMFGLTSVEELFATGLDEEYFRSAAKSEAEGIIKEELVVYAIAQAEGFTVSKEEYNAKVKDMAAFYGIDESIVRREFTAQNIETKVLYDEAVAFVAKNAKVVVAAE